jgi:flagellar motor protein MotB
VHAPITDYKADGGRLIPKSVASLAPVVSDGTETGRAKNRRVELVKQWVSRNRAAQA